MKKIITFVVFVVLLAQQVGIAHAIADSFHTEYVHSISDIKDTAGENSEHENCLQSCHGHSHSYINFNILKSPYIQKNTILEHKDQTFTDLNHVPDSPPPDFS